MTRVLVLSDDPAVHEAAATALRPPDCAVSCAVHIHEVEPLLASGPADVALIDCTLLGPGAEALASRLASRHGVRPVLLAHRTTGKEAGWPLLAKPLAAAELRQAIQAATRAGPLSAAQRRRGGLARLRGALRARGRSAVNRLLGELGVVLDRHVRQYRLAGLRFVVPSELTTPQLRARFVLGAYEAPERALARRHVPADARVLELGGCLGVVSCVVNRRLADPTRHVVIEPHPQLAKVLEQNRDLNGCRFLVERRIVASAPTVIFHQRDPFVGGGSTVRLGGRAIEVATTSVAALEHQSGLRFDTLIIDIEGGEAAFFAENAELIGRLRALILELHPHIIGEAACQRVRELCTAAGLRRRRRIGGVEAWTRARPMRPT